jgi:hypothetical protein
MKGCYGGSTLRCVFNPVPVGVHLCMALPPEDMSVFETKRLQGGLLGVQFGVKDSKVDCFKCGNASSRLLDSTVKRATCSKLLFHPRKSNYCAVL